MIDVVKYIKKTEQLKTNLCVYDLRNPDNLLEDSDATRPYGTPCYCDNCFYGRTELADELIHHREQIARRYQKHQNTTSCV
jgi:hypothetical protein